jgi:hypothetical protein
MILFLFFLISLGPAVGPGQSGKELELSQAIYGS